MTDPRAELPYMPGYDEMIDASGGKTLPWAWAVARMAECRNFWLTTLRSEGGPHTMPVWGVWLREESAFGFSTGTKSRKARNFRADPRAAIASENGAEGVVLEGRVEGMPASSKVAFTTAYLAKYNFAPTEEMGLFYVVRPSIAFGIPGVR